MTTATDEMLIEAAKEWIGCTGAVRLDVMQVDVEPRAWLALAIFPPDDNRIAAGFTEVSALLTLCSELGTDGICLDCEKSTIFEPIPEMTVLYNPKRFCVTTFDYEKQAFVRSCDGNH